MLESPLIRLQSLEVILYGSLLPNSPGFWFSLLIHLSFFVRSSVVYRWVDFSACFLLAELLGCRDSLCVSLRFMPLGQNYTHWSLQGMPFSTLGLLVRANILGNPFVWLKDSVRHTLKIFRWPGLIDRHHSWSFWGLKEFYNHCLVSWLDHVFLRVPRLDLCLKTKSSF